VSAKNAKSSDLVELAKQSREFREHYGKWWGGLLLLCVINAAAGRRPFLWGGLISLGTVVGGLVLKYGRATIGG
jgi:hypothetical protein